MSRKPSFANLRDRATPPPPAPAAAPAAPAAAAAADAKGPASRQGRKQIAGFFTPDMSLAMHMLARRQDRSLQALMAEAFNDVLRKYGESPIGE
ncbi:ribbon-helix-helix domain-containing protein [Sphingomonas sp. SAFR-052]|uniref:ribbon-helix-helix domain-containing protein n=1 Tax=Sphingomonas sp. SAFR-052 TaxID=3436867 RepID=UPI003F7F483B